MKWDDLTDTQKLLVLGFLTLVVAPLGAGLVTGVAFRDISVAGTTAGTAFGVILGIWIVFAILLEVNFRWDRWTDTQKLLVLGFLTLVIAPLAASIIFGIVLWDLSLAGLAFGVTFVTLLAIWVLLAFLAMSFGDWGG